ncbi:MAG: hypothetical protein JWP88_1973 [Flaviaesturariibacter sp.]|nr:hypothetical protein [Flaviaesturariibacter sp.]
MLPRPFQQYLSISQMKNLILTIALFTASFSAFAQAQRVQENNDPFIKHQADSLKALYAKDGFILLKEASINMESEYEIPVVVPLTAGTWYQFVFIGEPTSKLYEVRMFDWSEKQVVYQKKMWGDVDGNIITYSYIPKITEYHMMRPVQVNKKKKKNLPGYVMMFKRTGAPVKETK